MALRARDRGMRARERKRGLRMIKGSAGPINGAVANGTIQRKAGLHMIRVGCAVVFGQMTGAAVGWRVREGTVRMALVALKRSMGAREWKRSLRVIENGIGPTDRRMAK